MNAWEIAEKKSWIRAQLIRHERSLLLYATRLLSGDFEKARDMVQETFLQLVNKDPSELQGREKAWLFAVCRNKTIDYLRKEKRMKPMDNLSQGRLADKGKDQAEVLEMKESMKGVLSALNKLTPNQQEVFRLKFQNGLSYKEIKEITGLSISNIGFILHTAIRSLQKTLNPNSDQNQSQTKHPQAAASLAAKGGSNE